MKGSKPMYLVVDSGSSKTDWRIIDHKGRIEQVSTLGLNPYFVNTDQFIQIVKTEIVPLLSSTVEMIWFYGSGLASEIRSEEYKRVLRDIFKEAKIEVNGDLLAAARATCGTEEGISCISGTGSGACLYKNEEISEKSLGNGIWLGDEGSAGNIGKLLIIGYLENNLPDHIRIKFEKRFSDRRDHILQNVYHEAFPNKYLANFSKFIYHNRKDPYCYKLVYNSYNSFFSKSVKSLSDFEKYKVHFVGSTSFYFTDILRSCAIDNNISIGKILEKPISGLTLYHSKILNLE